MNRASEPRTRAVIETAAAEGFLVVVRGQDDGTWTALAFCIADARRDFVETGETESTVTEAVARRLEVRSRASEKHAKGMDFAHRLRRFCESLGKARQLSDTADDEARRLRDEISRERGTRDPEGP